MREGRSARTAGRAGQQHWRPRQSQKKKARSLPRGDDEALTALAAQSGSPRPHFRLSLNWLRDQIRPGRPNCSKIDAEPPDEVQIRINRAQPANRYPEICPQKPVQRDDSLAAPQPSPGVVSAFSRRALQIRRFLRLSGPSGPKSPVNWASRQDLCVRPPLRHTVRYQSRFGQPPL